MSLGTILYTWLYGHFVDEDDQQNKYYCNSKDFDDLEKKRWVIFKDEIESTKVPPQWHAWLHKSIDKPPLNYTHKYSWQKNHEQNKTGTDQAYFPDSHPLSKTFNKEAIKSEYDSWSP